MSYYLSRQLSGITFEEARQKAVSSLQAEGFGVLTEIDIKATMKKKLDKDYLPHVILGACNPVYADKVLTVDPHVSTLLPCNVTVRQTEGGTIEVAAIDPESAMTVVRNAEVDSLAGEVRRKLVRVIDSL
jgi:uncharacterized protein (DUF302 family)